MNKRAGTWEQKHFVQLIIRFIWNIYTLLTMVEQQVVAASKIEQVDCPYWKEAYEYFKQNRPEFEWINDKNHMCYCIKCHKKRNDKDVYHRGKPLKPYEIPIGFAGFSVKINEDV